MERQIDQYVLPKCRGVHFISDPSERKSLGSSGPCRRKGGVFQRERRTEIQTDRESDRQTDETNTQTDRQNFGLPKCRGGPLHL
jgi:hypothetical protein